MTSQTEAFESRDALSASGICEFEQACDRFEAAWRDCNGAELRDFLAEYSLMNQERLFAELLSVELDYRRRCGETPVAADYLESFPAYKDIIEAVVSLVSGEQPTTLLAPAIAPFDGAAAKTSSRMTKAASRRARLLGQTWPFSTLPEALLIALARRMRRRRFAAGDWLIRQGQPGFGLAMMTSGEGEVILVERSGRRRRLSYVRSGDVVGEMSLLTSEPCTADVVATQAGEALFLRTSDVRRVLTTHPVFGAMLTYVMAGRFDGSHDVLVGKHVGGYRILRRIGRGGMAIVYEARGGSPRRCALKMMHHRFAYDWPMVQRFEREAAMCAALEHPNILRTYGQFTAFHTKFIVMELCTGTTLADELVRHGPLEEDRVRPILGQLAAALAYAHQRGVVHRDIKPSNLLVEADGGVKLGDFGLARFATAPDITAPGSLLGSMSYMAPEQLAGEPATEEADLYALGLIACELFSGRAVFPEAEIAAQLRRRAVWSLPCRAQLPGPPSTDLYEVLRQCLINDPRQRTLDLRLLARWAPQRATDVAN